MTNAGNQLARLMPSLSARERAILILHSWKEGQEEDPLWRRTIPQGQNTEFNRYIGLMNAANVQLLGSIRFLDHETEKLQLRMAWLFSLSLWHLNLAEIDFAAALVSHQTITESEHDRLVSEHQNDYLRVQDAAYRLVEERRAWKDEDLETGSGWQELIVKPTVWRRMCKEAEAEITEAVEAGELEGLKGKKGLIIKRASFDAWCGRPITLRPDWAASYQVVPDSLAANAIADNRTLTYLREAIQSTPVGRLTNLGAGVDASLHGLIETVGGTAQKITEARWKDLRAVEILVDEIGEAFDEDPLLPRYRELLDSARLGLDAIARELRVHAGFEVGLDEPEAAYVRELRDKLGLG